MMRQIRSNYRRVRGFTLVEMMVVLLLVAALYAVFFGQSSGTDQKTKIHTEVSNMNFIMTSASGIKAGRPSYAGVDTAYLLSQNAFPSSMVDNGVVYNAWRGTVTVGPAPGNTAIQITTNNIPSAACTEWVGNNSRNWIEVSVAGTATKNGNAVADLATVQAACASSANVAIVFTGGQ